VRENRVPLLIRYDGSAKAAYIYLKPNDTKVARTIVTDSAVNLDFDARGHLVGIEILDASKVLPQEVLAAVKADTSR
jgi:uncharacterized protein YuzE